MIEKARSTFFYKFFLATIIHPFVILMRFYQVISLLYRSVVKHCFDPQQDTNRAGSCEFNIIWDTRLVDLIDLEFEKPFYSLVIVISIWQAIQKQQSQRLLP